MSREHVWLSFIVIGVIAAFFSVYYPAISVLAVVFVLIGIKGVMFDLL